MAEYCDHDECAEDWPCPHHVLVLLDLDHTLIHSDETLDHKEMESCGMNVSFRPGVVEFIKKLQEDFVVGVWTAAGKHYAFPIISRLFQSKPPALIRTYSDCTFRLTSLWSFDNYEIIKKVKKIPWDIKRILIVDDTPSTYQQNYGNAVAITKWFKTQQDDHVLVDLLKYLRQYKGAWSVRHRAEELRWTTPSALNFYENALQLVFKCELCNQHQVKDECIHNCIVCNALTCDDCYELCSCEPTGAHCCVRCHNNHTCHDHGQICY